MCVLSASNFPKYDITGSSSNVIETVRYGML
jgi:hypothetical protein